MCCLAITVVRKNFIFDFPDMTVSGSEKHADKDGTDGLTITDMTLGIETLYAKLARLQEIAADSAETLRNQLDDSNSRLASLKEELHALRSQSESKRSRELSETTAIFQEQFDRDMEAILREAITVPDYKMRLYWDNLRFKLEPSSAGGVAVTLSFPHSTRLSDLQFVLQFVSSDETFMVTDCDPMVIGLTDLVSTLNSDSRPGALARFCCRVRSTYTAQYSTDI